MKIALYGVSRSGKNYLIEKLIEKLNSKESQNLYHCEGSVTLNKLSYDKYNKPFKELPEKIKNQFRNEFPDLLKTKELVYTNVIVDGHYAFIENDNYKIVFTDADKDAYDAFFYLDTPSDMIVNFSKNSEGEKKNITITEDQVALWKQFEIEALKKHCKELNKELIILDECTENCLEFMENYILASGDSSFIAKEIATQIISDNQHLISSYQEIVVLDCDKTISENDVTFDFCSAIGINVSELKRNFINDRYSLYQFYNIKKQFSKHNKIDLNRACEHAKNQVIINHCLIKDVKKNHPESLHIGLTSGVHMIWDAILQELEFTDLLIGCHDLSNYSYLISAQVKLEFILQLKQQGKTVSAIGDSLIDAPMLEAACKGFVIAHEKLSNGMIEYFKNTDTNIQQLSYSRVKYDNIQISEGIK